MYKTLGFRWLIQAFYPASAFVSADSDDARNPQRFIHVTVGNKHEKDTAHIDTSNFGDKFILWSIIGQKVH